MSFPKYEAYRQSDVEWLSQMPVGWTTTSLRSLARVGKNTFIDGDWIEAPYITDDGIRLIQTGNVGVGSYREQGYRYISEETFDTLGCTEVAPGDVLICRLAEPVGRACLAPSLPSRMITSVDVAILKTRSDVHPAFVVYLLSSPEYLGFMEGQCRGGTRDRVSRSFLGQVRIPLPSFEEQQAIASFLDRETSKIDTLIDEQKRLIELLKEKRQAVISHAVTKGLNPDAPMKDSRIEWLGMVPAHWDVAPVGRRYSVQLGKMLDTAKQTGDWLRPYLRVFDVQWHEINVEDLPQMDFPPDAQGRYRLERGDLLVNEGGSYVGRSAVWKGDLDECYYQKALHRLRPYSKAADTADFMLYVMEYATKLQVFVAGGNQTTIDHLTAEQLRAYRFAFPPFPEQKEIVNRLQQITGEYDNLIQVSEAAITLLQERRSALISAAVTGKIDVRGLVKIEAQAEVEAA